MKAEFRNNTKLNLDMYREGINISYRVSHKLVRAVSYAYAIITLIIAYAFFLYDDLFLGGFFLLIFAVILFWNTVGYKLGTKSSFLRFAKLHGSHYQVDMEYTFLEDRLFQETEKTELTVMYSDIDIVYVTDKLIIIIFDKKVIIIDRASFVDCRCEDVIKFIEERKVKVRHR